MTTTDNLTRAELVVKNTRLIETLHAAEATIKAMEVLANDEQQKRREAEDQRVEARSALAYAEQETERNRLEHGELARHVADLPHDLIAAEVQTKHWAEIAEQRAEAITRQSTEIIRLNQQIVDMEGQLLEEGFENERLKTLLTGAVLLMRPGSSLCKRTLAALGRSQ